MLIARKLQRFFGDLPITSPNHPDLVAMYTMDNISGSTLVNEEGTSASDGTISGATTVAGKVNDALQIDDTEYVTFSVSLPSSLGVTGSAFFWIYMADLTGVRRFIASSNTSSNSELYILLSVDSKLLINNTNLNTIEVDTALSVGWNSIYINGNGSSTSVDINNSASTTTVTAGSDTGGWFNSPTSINQMDFGRLVRSSGTLGTKTFYIDETRFFNRSLTSQERSELYNGGSGA